MGLIKRIINVFNIVPISRKIKESEKRERSVRFALSAIVYSLLMFFSALAGCMLVNLNGAGILIFLLIAIAAVLFIGAVIEFFGAMLRVIVQFTINRNVSSWLAFIVFIASFAATVYVFFYYFG